jgi:hypothetical protein
MSIPSVPTFLIEGPASACIINGHYLGWKNCTTLSFAMGIDKSTLGKVRLSGCQVRDETGDTIGGTTIEQCAKVALNHGVRVEVHTGPNVCTPAYAATQLQAGRGFSLSGNTSAIGKTNTNHNIWINHCSGGTLGHPAYAAVYDPWSKGVSTWTWAKVLAFAAALRPWGEADSRTLGPGKFYSGIFPDTEPHMHPRFAAVKTTPFPDRAVVNVKAGTKANVRSGPAKTYSVVATLADGAAWVSWQYKANGGTDNGTTGWYGNHDGTRWTHQSNLSGKGGAI